MTIKDIGRSAILENLAEECSELSWAALKEARRLRGENPTPATEEECRRALTEEAGDVINMISLLSDLGVIDEQEMHRVRLQKMFRWAERLDSFGKA